MLSIKDSSLARLQICCAPVGCDGQKVKNLFRCVRIRATFDQNVHNFLSSFDFRGHVKRGFFGLKQVNTFVRQNTIQLDTIWTNTDHR